MISSNNVYAANFLEFFKEVVQVGDPPLVGRLILKTSFVFRLDTMIGRLYPNQVIIKINNAEGFLSAARTIVKYMDVHLQRPELKLIHNEMENSLLLQELKEKIVRVKVGLN